MPVEQLDRSTFGGIAVRVLRIATWVALVATAGCLHHRDIVACVPGPGESECWESSRRDANGHLRHVVVERVTPDARCDKVVVVQDSFDEHGVLVERAVDERRCRVVDRRRIDRYDLAAGELERDLWFDTNHDDDFDRVEHHTVRLSEPQRSFATHAAEAEAAELDAAHSREEAPP
ncbi:MAG TPA: hypothetical protein VFG69_17875 [Nannocystaceae bacterium]|nr:hypothetical protein [Nannocystaceae bacterium]